MAKYLHIYLLDHHAELLYREAQKRGVPRSLVVRDLIDKALGDTPVNRMSLELNEQKDDERIINFEGSF